MKPAKLQYALALTLVAVVVLATGMVAAQQAPPSWKQGQPPELANSPLSPVAQPPAPKAPGEIPVDRIKLPPASRPSCGRTASTTRAS
jgi:hypothetical protein